MSIQITNYPPIQITVENLPSVIPLRYYRGWNISFNIKTETFQSEILCLFGFTNPNDLERAIDIQILNREKPQIKNF